MRFDYRNLIAVALLFGLAAHADDPNSIFQPPQPFDVSGSTVHVDNFPATIAISGPIAASGSIGVSGPIAITGPVAVTGHIAVDSTVLAPDAARESKQDVTNAKLDAAKAVLDSIAAKDFATETTLAGAAASLATIAGRTPALVSGRVPVDGSGVTQPVTGSVAVSGPMSVTNFPAVQAISGYVGQTGGPWSVSGSLGRTWTTSSGTDSMACTQSGTWTVQQGTPPWSVSQSGNWDIRNVTGTVSLPTNACQETGGNLSTIVARTPVLGQAAMSASRPVVVASDQTDLPTYQTDATSSSSFSASSATPTLLALSGRKSAIGVVTGTWTGSLTWGVSYDGATCVNQATYTPALNQFFSTTAANTTINFYPLVGVKAVCVTPTTISSGTAVVRLTATAADTLLPGPFYFKVGSTASQYGLTVGGTDGTNGRPLVLKNATPASSDYGVVNRSLIYDGSANPLASSTSAPSGTEQALIVRPIEKTPVDVDTFGSQLRASRIVQIQADFSQALTNNDVTSTVTGTATVTQASASATLTSSTAVTGSAKLQSNSVLSYTPGRELYSLFTAAFTTPSSANSSQSIGIYDSSNGFFVGFTGTNFGVTHRQNGVDTFTAQASFNGDTLTGTATSMFQRGGVSEALDKTKKNIYRIRYGWLGVAPIRFEILSPDGRWVTFHTIRYPNTSVNPHTYSTTLPITSEVVKSNADATNLLLSTSSWDAGTTGSPGEDLTYLGSLAALNAAVTTNTNGKSTVSFNVQSIGTNQLTVEAQNGDLNWKAVTAYSTDGVSTSVITTNGLYVVPVFGYSQVRIRVSTYVSGTTTIASNASVAVSFVLTSNAQNTKYVHINSATTTVVKSGPGLLFKICVNSLAAGITTTIYDNTAATGTTIGILTTGTNAAGFSGNCLNYDGMNFNTGLTFVTSSSSIDLTVTYK
jgi:hypothetical protein